jgi:hypothetical protein
MFKGLYKALILFDNYGLSLPEATPQRVRAVGDCAR